MARIGISSDEAFRRLFAEARATIHDWYHLNVVNKLKEPVPHSANHFSRHFCTRILIYARVTLLLLIIGSVDIDNEMQFTLMVINITLFAFSILVQFWQRKCREAQLDYRFRKALKLLDSLEKNFPSIYTYQSTVEPATEETITCQTTFRDGRVVEVPRVLLAQGDIILLRPGQVAPCDCETFEGVALSAGEKLNQKRMLEERPVGAVIPLESVQARVTTFPVKQLLDTVLTMDDKPLQFDYQLHHVVHHVFERILVPFVGFLAIFGSVLRFLYSDDESYFGTRFIFAVPGLAVLPLLVLPLPVILHIVKRANNKKILKEMRLEDREISQKDLASILAAVTGTCITDKKGVLSTIHPLIEKVIFVAKPEESPENVQETGNEDLHIEVLNMSAEQREDVFSGWSLGFEDQHWLRYLPNLMPLAHNILLNSCSQTENFTKFLDHLTVVAQSVPRTIATANRRCMCQFPRIVGFSENCLDQFASPPTAVVGLYKRKPGEAPLPGLTKHRTPIEMAFCTVHSDVRSLHSHLSCHGTANLVLDACTHAWDGKTVVPLNKRLVASIRDYYQRHSMTGHCLAVSYRPVFSSLDESLQGKYLEVPLNREEARTSSAIPRSQSFDTLRREGIVENELLKTSDQVIDHYFTGHIFCGLIVLQYEALPLSVQLIEKLDAICVRPVYFSKENELRSRVFAEKLGIEAGWNCHISLADEEAPTKREEIATEQFIDQRPQRTKFWKRLAMSDAQIHLIECESVSRELPAGQKISMCSNKVGPIPNKARLPTGVSNIRPHLEEVDNVPLLVGLFTDSATLAMEEMVDIMQVELCR
ncbi:unnamed protein product [Caenorhabditis auriculariae]|uniref:P-type ATPase A domain-containing protein n=1 Tax=Caenorhabditis auriculariae TaxID=2777116 RepID=A0A8S1GZB7_9PELO|nr:unnamed protein product [Caenorhabditis auriculariae]